MPTRTLLRASILGVMTMPATLYLAWATWTGFEARLIIWSKPSIDAQIETISMYKHTYYGDIAFEISKNGHTERCRVHEQLANESFRLRTGQIIQIVPRDGCENPVVVNKFRGPIFFLILTLISVICQWTLVRHAIRGHRPATVR